MGTPQKVSLFIRVGFCLITWEATAVPMDLARMFTGLSAARPMTF